MKLYPYQQLTFDSPLIKRAHEIVNDLILEYGIHVWVDLEQSAYQIKPLVGAEPETAYCITGIRYCLGEIKFETINELRRALQNKAFL